MSFLVSAAATAASTAAVAGIGATAGLTAGAVGMTAGALAGGATAGALGAGVGAISAAAQGQDVGKGALMGAASGVVTAGVASGLGAAGAGTLIAGTVGGAAGGAAGAAAGGEDVGKGAMIGGATGAVTSGVGELGGAVAGPTTPVDVAPVTPSGPMSPTPTSELSSLNNVAPVDAPISGPMSPKIPGSIQPSPSSDLFASASIAHPVDAAAKGLTNLTGSSITGDQLSGGLKALTAGALTDYAGHSMVNADEAAKKANEQNAIGAANFANQDQAAMSNLKGLGFNSPSGPLSSLGNIGKATGGLTALAHGGQVPLKDGAYIIPADVVSALGNGSSKAGAEFLRQLMMEVRKEAVNIQGLGAAKKHGA
jgi:hypothetical protein